MFADQLLRAHPDLPAEEEGRMNDTGLREDFVERVFAHHRLRRFLEDGPTRHGLVRFHTAHKAMLFTRHEPGSRELGAFLGNAGRQDIGALTQGYADRFRAILAHRSTAGRHTNVLHHAMGHLKRILDSAQKRQLLAAIEDYRLGHQPRSLALTLIDFLARSHEVEYLRGQLYFDPCPKELLPGDRTRRAWPRTSVA